jgi:hypothetical protein
MVDAGVGLATCSIGMPHGVEAGLAVLAWKGLPRSGSALCASIRHDHVITALVPGHLGGGRQQLLAPGSAVDLPPVLAASSTPVT